MQNRNILIIDDEPKMCKILRFALEPHGYTVTTAESAEEGLEKFGQAEFDLVVTDLKMPGKDGLHVLGKVKKQRPNTEVIFTFNLYPTIVFFNQTFANCQAQTAA